jgi:hypothetical protein
MEPANQNSRSRIEHFQACGRIASALSESLAERPILIGAHHIRLGANTISYRCAPKTLENFHTTRKDFVLKRAKS